MKFILPSTEVAYKVTWQYDGDYASSNHDVVITRCHIWNQAADTIFPSSSGWARKAPNDPMDKNKGRKISLKNAIQFLSREDRTHIWATYLSESPKRKR